MSDQPKNGSQHPVTEFTAPIAGSPVMQNVMDRLNTVADSNSTILLVGETGVGKELIAAYIHQHSSRRFKPFIKVGLAALPSELLESELFGHERGSYTGAHAEKRGLFELADQGMIFLDDIDDFPIGLQAKLLRVLENHEIMRIGGEKTIPIDVRVVCASKVNLRELVEKNMFRADLYYRINVVPVYIPPLRERSEDVIALAEHFLAQYANGKNLRLTQEVQTLLSRYSWPGNVRELRNTVQRMSLFATGAIGVEFLPKEIAEENPLDIVIKGCGRCLTDLEMSYDEVVQCLEVNLIHRALTDTGGNQTQAAKMLRMSLSTFRDKLKKFGLDKPS